MSNKSRQPGARDVLLKRLNQIIADHGWAVTGVSETGHCDMPGCRSEHKASEPFLYTVGLTAAGLPELLLERVPYQTATHVLNELALQSTAAELEPGRVYTLNQVPGRFTVTPVPQSEAWTICKGAKAMFGARLRVLRVNWQTIS